MRIENLTRNPELETRNSSEASESRGEERLRIEPSTSSGQEIEDLSRNPEPGTRNRER